jgi:hypothetical protein
MVCGSKGTFLHKKRSSVHPALCRESWPPASLAFPASPAFQVRWQTLHLVVFDTATLYPDHTQTKQDLYNRLENRLRGALFYLFSHKTNSSLSDRCPSCPFMRSQQKTPPSTRRPHGHGHESWKHWWYT